MVPAFWRRCLEYQCSDGNRIVERRQSPGDSQQLLVPLREQLFGNASLTAVQGKTLLRRR